MSGPAGRSSGGIEKSVNLVRIFLAELDRARTDRHRHHGGVPFRQELAGFLSASPKTLRPFKDSISLFQLLEAREVCFHQTQPLDVESLLVFVELGD